MATHAYDDLYSYLAAFKNSSLAEIIAYLEELGQRRFDAFIRGLAPLIPIEKIENQSQFNFSVDSTLEGGKFPCTDYACLPVESKTFTIWQSSQHCMQIKH